MDPALRELLLRGEAEDEIEAVLRFAHGVRTAPPGVAVVARFDAIATCRLKRRDIPRVREAPGVASLKAPRLLGPERPPVAVEPGSASPGPGDARRPHGLAETGRGVVIGVLDWGLDVAAASFRHADGSTRLLGLWDQRTRRGRRQRNAYGYGWIHSPRAINAALRSANPYAALDYDAADSDPVGVGAHGTVVTDLAAGNGRSGLPPGVAPGADIVFVHLASRDTAGLANLGDSIGILEGLDFIRRVAAGRPLVCSLSVGGMRGRTTGPRSSNSASTPSSPSRAGARWRRAPATTRCGGVMRAASSNPARRGRSRSSSMRPIRRRTSWRSGTSAIRVRWNSCCLTAARRGGRRSAR